jgi:DegV family protein with EDD domain
VVKVITDSLGGIPSDVVSKLGLTIIPITVLFGTEVYRDGVNLTTEQFYDKLVRTKVFPTTAVPPLGDFVKVYDRLAEETDEILVITISSKLSGIYQAAKQAVELMKKKRRVEVIDSRFVVMAEGLIAISAAREAQQGANLDRLVDLTQHNIARADARFAFDTLEYLKRGGRIGKATAFLGSLLKVHPVLTIKEGAVHPVKQERSRSKAIDNLYNFVISHSHVDDLAVEDATTPEEADMLADRLGVKFPRERILRAKVSPTIGAHVGPHVIGVSLLGEK